MKTTNISSMIRTAAVLLGFALFAAGSVASGAGFAVNSTSDVVDAVPGDSLCDDGTGNCTLRAAIMEANALSGADTVTLPTGTYTLSIAPEPNYAEDTAAAKGDLDITEDLTLTGAGEASSIVDGDRLDRVFDVHDGSTVTISGVTIQNGYSRTRNGGGIKNAGDLTINDSTITLNESLNHSGGILNSNTLTISNCTISDNKTGGGGSGGGISNSASATIAGSTIINNICGNGGGGIQNTGTMNISNSTISNNHTAEFGLAGGIYNSSSGTLTLTNSIVEGNSAFHAGGIWNSSWTTLNIFKSIIRSNNATSDGGGILTKNDVTLLIENTFITDNTAGDEGGGMHNSWCSPVITNCTFSGNSAATRGGAMYNYQSAPAVTNSIIWNNSVDQVFNDGRNPTFSYCDIQGSNGSGTGWDTALGIDAGGNIDADPLFVGGGDCHLTASSPCIDTGTSTGAPAVDIDDEPRPQGGGYDMGADELLAVGNISGRVTTSVTGQLTSIFGATVTIVETGQSTTSDDNGDYIFSNVLVGTYTIRVEKDGFETIPSVNVQVQSGQTTSIPGGEMTFALEGEEFPCDVNEDGKIGLEEAIYVLQIMAGIKQDPWARYSAGGTYTYVSDTLTLNISVSNFPTCAGPSVAQESFTIVSLTETAMTWEDEDNDQMTWTRKGQTSPGIVGTWEMAENGDIYEGTFFPDGSFTVTGYIQQCGDNGIYGPGFEFEIEDASGQNMLPTAPGTYVIGTDVVAVDFENVDTPYNLHAYGGSITIYSISPLFQGSFELSNFAQDHGGPADLTGQVTGFFSVPQDGRPVGAFAADGTVDGYSINISEEKVFLTK